MPTQSSVKRSAMAPLTAVLFLLSGGLALVYELCWIRALTLEMGSTTLAVATVVAVFMGGLALGADFGGRWTDQCENPFRAYGRMEILLGVYALATPCIFRHALALFTLVAGSAADSFMTISILRASWVIVLLIVPTFIMGISLPLLVCAGRSWLHDASRWAGLLYGLNTIGAFGGTLAAGFILLSKLGLYNTLHLTGTGVTTRKIL